jgi:hypothetical protein
MHGAIPIMRGCALRIWVIISGEQAGKLWEDRRDLFLFLALSFENSAWTPTGLYASKFGHCSRLPFIRSVLFRGAPLTSALRNRRAGQATVWAIATIMLTHISQYKARAFEQFQTSNHHPSGHAVPQQLFQIASVALGDDPPPQAPIRDGRVRQDLRATSFHN